MASPALTACVCVLLLHTVRGLQSEDREERLCAFSNNLQGAESASINGRRRVVKENGTIHCSRGSSCYGLWETRADGEMLLLKQGCWTFVGNQHECHDDGCFLATAASSQRQKDNYRFCCCNQDLCNANYTKAPPTTTSPNHHQFMSEQSAVSTMVTVTTAAILIVALFLGYRVMKRREKRRLSAADVMEAANAEAARDVGSLELLELIGRGRYGSVFRGCLNGQRVAVKVFSSANRKKFLSERSMYRLPLLQQHHNIARFLTSEEKMSTDGHRESLIVMEFYPHGCLSEYLSLHTVDWLTCCRMTHDVTKGLSFLHTELRRGELYKPAVAHRDLTSRNVLVRPDLSCVLAGFGASMKLTSNKPCHPGDNDSMAISEVGTVRYMSPEVLGRGLNLKDCELALKPVDIYALGLLYWESFRRCSDLFPGETVPQYQLAFQEELGNHPRFEDIQVLVVRDKRRPRFPEAWKRNSLAVWSLKETMEECWEQDSEARLTAQCAEQRLAEVTLLSPHTKLDDHRPKTVTADDWRSSQPGSVYSEDSQSGQRKHLQHNEQHAALLCTSTREAKAGEKNCKSDLEFQQTQQTLPQRPTSLHLLPKKKTTSASARSTLGKFKFLYEQVETGVAKMNTVTEFSVLAEPHLVTTVTNNAIMRSSSVNGKGVNCVCRSYAESVPALVGNSVTGRGRVNPAGPQNEEEEVEVNLEIGIKGDDSRLSLLNCGPEEHEPLLRMEQLPAESEPHPAYQPSQNEAGDISTGLGSNSNNNNNSPAPHTQTYQSGSGASVLKAELGQAAETLSGYSASVSQQEHEIPGPGLRTPSLYNGTLTVEVPLTIQNEADRSDRSAHQKTAKNASALDFTREDQLLRSAVIIPSSDPKHQLSVSEKALEEKVPAALKRQLSQEPDPPSQEAVISDTLTCLQTPSSSKPSVLEDPSMYQEASPLTPEIAQSKANLVKGSKLQHEDLQIPTGEPKAPDLMQHPKARRRPCSLELSSSCISSGDVFMTSDGSLSATGKKIKQRVKTPYTLKKWCTTSWVASTDSSLDSDFECSTRTGGSCQVASGVKKGRVGIQKMNQSKSSMAVFVVGEGGTATKTSEHDGMICF
ncbi:bone morphogenetic protein receptor type-2 isoform X2 [Oryzias melastigma]|uniref:bone morphogenetic protein receptor type-2 isoform X2 n=1 Tax=Oryzias melastigma TaxID=30732 RepID=UPI00168CC8BD|nr:bone morphogenetic protein receptor type-2 isoform X2 [Oryzias melastigma]